VPARQAETLARFLLDQPGVCPIGLGARDSLRLEAGLCLYGNDINVETDPVSARLSWAIQKVRRTGGVRAGGFPGAAVVLAALTGGTARARVGLRPQGRAPMRDGVEIFDADQGGKRVGHVTSGGFGPTVGGPIAMGYVIDEYAEPGQQLWGEVRGKRMSVLVAKLPFVNANFKR